MTVAYQVESWETYRRDCQLLWVEQHAAHASGDMPLLPDEVAYSAMADAGILKVITARDCGALVGYVLCIIRPHIHHAGVICGFVDTFYLSMSARRGLTGIRLIQFAVQSMKDAGARKVFFMTDCDHDVGRIFERMKFRKSNVIWVGG